MDVTISRITVQYPAEVFIQWDVNPDNGVSGTYLFFVERSGSPEGPWRTVAGPLGNTINYTENYASYADTSPSDDTTSDQANLLSFKREIYYRIQATAPDGVQAYSPVVDLDGVPAHTINAPIAGMGATVTTTGKYYAGNSPVQNPRNTPQYPQKRLVLMRRKILREEYITLKNLSGVLVSVLKKRYFGVICSNCTSTLTRSILKNKCDACHGTGWEGGFFDPVQTFANFRPAQVNSSTADTGITEITKTSATMLAYPKVEEGDVIVEHDTNRRWRVDSCSPTELRRMLLHQRVVVSELSRDSVEYGILV